ncbi:MAG: hypothetical protein MI866_09095 [Bacteroidales bacterium]|nr:hypothetical protein [Bacteroidales bacterium]
MKKSIIAIIVSFCLLATHDLSGQNTMRLSDKEVFHIGYPKNISFRGEYREIRYQGYDEWKHSLDGFSVINKKFVNYDEMARDITGLQTWAKKYHKQHPEKLLLLHWDAREHRNDQPGSSDRYFPGHWLSFPGSYLSSAVNARQKQIQVESVKPFGAHFAYRDEEYPGQLKYKPGSFFYPILLLVELDKDGNRLWDKYEYVKLLEINEEDNTLRIERAQSLSESRSFPHGSYVAPMSTRLGKEGLFDYNCSALCPKDKNGKTALDIMHDELVDLLSEGGDLDYFDGIAFDVLQWLPRSNKVDSNNDGISDGGFIKGENLWQKGTYEFMKKLRSTLGNDVMITGDGYGINNQRGVGLFNGIESEGLVEHNDAYRGFAKTINVFSYWNKHNTVQPAFSYIVDKQRNASDQKNGDNLRRLYLGTVCCLGLGATVNSDLDELTAGADNIPNWLGQPVGDMVQLAKDAEGIELSLDENLLKGIRTENCELQIVNNHLVIKPTHKVKKASIELTELPTFITAEDVNFYIDVKAQKGLQGYAEEIPGIVYAHAHGLPQYEKNKGNNKRYNEQIAFFGKDTHTISFYYRQCANQLDGLKLTFEGKQAIVIESAGIKYAPATLLREFENGLVLVNPSFDEVLIDISGYETANGFRKIKGKTHPMYNTGEAVSKKVSVAPLNALFLQRIPQ